MNQLPIVPTTFTIETALASRDQNTFPAWLDSFLRGPGNNVPLADGLKRDTRWWFGPQELSLASLELKCGPGLEFHEDEDGWTDRINILAQEIKKGLKVPPLIAEFKAGRLLLADGNHRHGALQLCRVYRYWTAVWFNSKEDFDLFVEANR